MATIAAMSSRGQIVLPIAIRKKLGLGEPSLDEFYSLTEQAQRTAAKLGLTEEEINTGTSRFSQSSISRLVWENNNLIPQRSVRYLE